MIRRVLVTGANGFVGNHVCDRLLRDGMDVVGTVRRTESVTQLHSMVTPIVTGDITGKPDWSLILDGVDAVIHLAARTHVVRDRMPDSLSKYRRINVSATENLLMACGAANISRFLFLSSIKAVGEGANDPYSESTVCQPEDAYGISKREAELRILEMTRATDIEPVIIRSPLVYGPGVRGNFRSLMQLVNRRIPLPIASVRNARSMVYVQNLADAIALVLMHPAAGGQTFHVADDQPVSTRELIERIAAMMQRRPRMLACPVSVLKFFARIFGQSDRVARLTSSLTVSTEKIRELLGWSPPISFESGLRQTVDWFLSAKTHNNQTQTPADGVVDHQIDRAA